MITKQQIKQMTSSRFYERGKQIYSTGWMIEKFSVGREDNLDLLRRMILGQPVPDARLYSPEEVEQSRQTPFES